MKKLVFIWCCCLVAVTLFTFNCTFAQGQGQGQGKGLLNSTGLENGQGFTTGQGHLNGNSSVNCGCDESCFNIALKGLIDMIEIAGGKVHKITITGTNTFIIVFKIAKDKYEISAVVNDDPNEGCSFEWTPTPL